MQGNGQPNHTSTHSQQTNTQFMQQYGTNMPQQHQYNYGQETSQFHHPNTFLQNSNSQQNPHHMNQSSQYEYTSHHPQNPHHPHGHHQQHQQRNAAKITQHQYYQQQQEQQKMHTERHNMPKNMEFEVDFDLGSNYELQRTCIGKGSYGAVCSALHKPTDTMVAVKKIPKAFTHSVEDTKRVLREIRILRQLNHQNIIKIKDIIPPRSYNTFKDIYIVLELMESDLAKVIYSQQDLSEKHIQYFIYQLMRALKYLHSAKILHRDLKPSNILLNSNCKLKLCDFGLARVHDEQDSQYDEQTLTKYVVTRWYRAPELLLQSNKYSAAIDIWSAGCIFAELLLRAPLFPGRNYLNQLDIISHVLGTPSQEDVLATNGDPDAMRYLLNKPQRPPEKPLSAFIPKASPLAIDLLKSMLQFNPQKRLTVDQVIEHPYLKDVRNLSAETLFSGDPNCFKTREKLVNQNSVKELIYREMLHYHPDVIYKEVKIRYTQNISDNSNPFLIDCLFQIQQQTTDSYSKHVQSHQGPLPSSQMSQLMEMQNATYEFQKMNGLPPPNSMNNHPLVHELLKQQPLMQQVFSNVNLIPYPVLSQEQHQSFVQHDPQQPILSYQDQEQMIHQQLLQQHQAHQQYVYGKDPSLVQNVFQNYPNFSQNISPPQPIYPPLHHHIPSFRLDQQQLQPQQQMQQQQQHPSQQHQQHQNQHHPSHHHSSQH